LLIVYFGIIYYVGVMISKFDKTENVSKCSQCDSNNIIEKFYEGSIEHEGKIHPLQYHYSICTQCKHEFFTEHQVLKNKKILLCTSVAAVEQQKPH
jgi:hypothetical protein